MKLQKIIAASGFAAALAITPLAFAGNSGHGHHGGHNHGQQQERTAAGVGEIREVHAQGKSVVLHHEPIRELRWPAMTMRLKLAKPELAEGLTAGDKVNFTLRQTGPTDYEIIKIESSHDH